MPKGYRVPLHFHPADQNLVIISGTLGVGMGDKLDTASGHDLNSGGFARMPQGMHLYAWAKSSAVIQVHGIGPFAFTNLNPADDPRNKHQECEPFVPVDAVHFLFPSGTVAEVIEVAEMQQEGGKILKNRRSRLDPENYLAWHAPCSYAWS